jgi:hypothetical protein
VNAARATRPQNKPNSPNHSKKDRRSVFKACQRSSQRVRPENVARLAYAAITTLSLPVSGHSRLSFGFNLLHYAYDSTSELESVNFGDRARPVSPQASELRGGLAVTMCGRLTI